MISEKQKQTVLECLQDGDSLRQACVKADIQRPAAVLDMVKRDLVFDEHYTRARIMGYEARADRLHDDAWDMTIPVDHKRILVDVQKWELSKVLPKVYGDRLNIEHTSTAADQLTVEELQAIIAAKDPPTA